MNNKNEWITTTQFKDSVPISKRTTSSTKADWLVPAALILLSAIPFLGGAFRLVGLASGAEITPENARFVAVPLPVVIHIISALLFCILGAFQFAPGFRRQRAGRHRRVGRLLVRAALLPVFRVCG